jgi:hypothetical protein
VCFRILFKALSKNYGSTFNDWKKNTAFHLTGKAQLARTKILD